MGPIYPSHQINSFRQDYRSNFENALKIYKAKTPLNYGLFRARSTFKLHIWSLSRRSGKGRKAALSPVSGFRMGLEWQT
jgi:hypothetical protein